MASRSLPDMSGSLAFSPTAQAAGFRLFTCSLPVVMRQRISISLTADTAALRLIAIGIAPFMLTTTGRQQNDEYQQQASHQKSFHRIRTPFTYLP
jgi:hypothetical protein